MKHTHALLILLAVACMASQCRKEDPEIVRAYLDVPFYINPDQKFYILDTVSTSPLVRRSVLVNIDNFSDMRDVGVVCMSSWGGYIEIFTKAAVNNTDSGLCRQSIRGCLGETDEWNPYINNNAPKCQIYDSLLLCLLKVEPVSSIPNNEKEYRFKYVFKRPK